VVQAKFQTLLAAYPKSRLLIVSNSAGTNDDPGHRDAHLLEKTTGIPVLRHATKKPGCGSEILSYFRGSSETGVTEASQIAIVGDRLFTDVMMANMMGSWSVWVKDGVVIENSPVSNSSFSQLRRL
jgi:phosphatidylglycerophosphatase GEP4